ncbi:hypothetical protein BZG36_03342 [Bifiguratus adelaidae]|uniref:WIBG Mago-binding domain-containing protein n=1 Tax=Bifiguratus adelaidae TaxID=1938954 RepID=A0A261XWM5_9FUNG|nr:hypothetical protein BZG36_03342 [Bifiguratus adelaidae]
MEGPPQLSQANQSPKFEVLAFALMSTASGIVATGGERIVPASRRPDGTLRKEIRIRPGYIPQEDVAKYTNDRIEGAKSPRTVPGAVPGAPIKVQAEKKSKNQKRNEKEKAAKTSGVEEKATAPVKDQVEEEPKMEADPAKRKRALEKKIRQIEQLKEKQAQGGTLLPEQTEKISKLDELMKELEALSL